MLQEIIVFLSLFRKELFCTRLYFVTSATLKSCLWVCFSSCLSGPCWYILVDVTLVSIIYWAENGAFHVFIHLLSVNKSSVPSCAKTTDPVRKSVLLRKKTSYRGAVRKPSEHVLSSSGCP